MKQLVKQQRKTFIKEVNLKQELVINFGSWSLEALLHNLGHCWNFNFCQNQEKQTCCKPKEGGCLQAIWNNNHQVEKISSIINTN
jgi:hypothetical protein